MKNYLSVVMNCETLKETDVSQHQANFDSFEYVQKETTKRVILLWGGQNVS